MKQIWKEIISQNKVHREATTQKDKDWLPVLEESSEYMWIQFQEKDS